MLLPPNNDSDRNVQLMFCVNREQRTCLIKTYDSDVPSHYVAVRDSLGEPVWTYDLEKEPSAVIAANIDADDEDEILVVIDSTLIALNVPLSSPTDISPQEGQIQSQIPEEYALFPNYPNPFNIEMDICYQIPDTQSSTRTSLKIYNVLGQEVRTFVDATQKPGYYTATWDASGLASGIYYYQLRADHFSSTKRMLLRT